MHCNFLHGGTPPHAAGVFYCCFLNPVPLRQLESATIHPFLLSAVLSACWSFFPIDRWAASNKKFHPSGALSSCSTVIQSVNYLLCLFVIQEEAANPKILSSQRLSPKWCFLDCKYITFTLFLICFSTSWILLPQ